MHTARLIISFLVTLSSFLALEPVLAHRLNVYAYPTGKEICIEASFAGGGPAKNAKVNILDDQGRTLMTSSTSSEGKTCIQTPADFQPINLTVVVNAGEGHQNQWTIDKSNFNGSAISSNPAPQTPVTVEENNPSKNSKSIKLFSQQELNEAVAAAKKDMEFTVITPLRKQLAEAQQPKTTFKDIVGGIGWLIGIAGLFAWYGSRRKKR